MKFLVSVSCMFYSFLSFSKDFKEIEFEIKNGENIITKLNELGVDSKDVTSSIFSSKRAKKIFDSVYPGQIFRVTLGDEGGLLSITSFLRDNRFFQVTKSYNGDYISSYGKEVPKIGYLNKNFKNYKELRSFLDSNKMDKSCKNSFINALNSYDNIKSSSSDFVVYFSAQKYKLRDKYICPVASKFINEKNIYNLVSLNKSNKLLYFDGFTGEQKNFSFLDRPIDGGRVSSYYSKNRLHPILNIIRPHNGIDYADKIGANVYATASGRVEYATRNGGYGNFVSIKHNSKYTTQYAHLKSISVKKGDYVKQGEVIGHLGNTGISTGPHVHYEIKRYGHPKNPLDIIKYYPNYKITDSNKWEIVKRWKNITEES